MPDESGISRRNMIGGVAGLAGLVALAGCGTSVQSEEYAGSVQEAAQEAPPSPPSNPNQDEYAQFVIESLAYQNRQQQAQSQGVSALINDAGIESGGDE